ncbi:MAG: hypothetical protein HS130_04305 [Deltaproteobacteria bacterium]|nr:hypothetical protein [Deltaproteobacteria bacterium]
MNKVDFFMIVTGDRDPDIADYAIKGFSKIKGLDFRLVVYSNYIHPVLKKRYFPRWSRYPYVDLVRNDFQDGTEPEKTGDVPLEGPFDPGWLVWDRNLKGLKARYVATVDADFEILSERFVHRMIEALDTDREAMGASVYYCPEVKDYFDTYRGTTFDIVGHWGSWCSIYRREGLDFGISMRNRFEKAGAGRPSGKTRVSFSTGIWKPAK